MPTRSIPCFLLLFFPIFLFAQQTVRGTILDKDSGAPVSFATIQLQDSSMTIGAVSDLDGKFRIDHVPIGKQNFLVSNIGYEPGILTNIEVTAGKEVVLNVELQESFQQLAEVVITARKEKGQALNDFATLSARSLNIEEANRYAATLGDPARQALNFAGVAGSGDDLMNEIVVRGNSPRGLLWRLEGMEIPNPNHFATLGSSGGAVSMLSSNVLATSDFYTGAFPGEFGNATSGVFDLKFRKGNNEKYETRFGAGFLGLELASEGPINKKAGSSYLVNYRYSTLGVLNNLGIKIAGDILPVYQDISFNFNVPTKNLGLINIYGIGGNNNYKFEDNEEAESFSSTEEERANLGILGLKHVYFLSNQTYIRSNINYSTQNSTFTESESNATFQYKYIEKGTLPSLRFSSLINHKFNARHTAQAGIIWSNLRQKIKSEEESDGVKTIFQDFNGQTNQIQSYLQWKWRLTEKLTLNSGLHYLYYQFTNKQALEPRAGLRWQYAKNRSLNIGAGLHSRVENLFVYALKNESEFGDLIQPNTNLDLNKAAHFVLGHDWSLNDHTRLKIEVYYQYLYNIPADSTIGFSAINAQNVFSFVDLNNLSNTGKGRNYGVEFTLERFLHNNFYYLSTLSLYQSEFSFDGKNHFSTRYNNNYVFNLLFGKEFLVGKKKENAFGLNLKATVSGGQRFTGLNEEATLATGELIYSSTPFNSQVMTYYRIDMGINYKFNLKKTTQRISLNVQNITNRLNEFEPDFELSPFGNEIQRLVNTQNGIIPVLKYSIDF